MGEGGDAGQVVLPGHGDEGLGAEGPGREGASSLTKIGDAVGPALSQPAARFGDILRTQWVERSQDRLYASLPGKARLLRERRFQVIAMEITLRQTEQAAADAEVSMPDREVLPDRVQEVVKDFARDVVSG